MYLKKCIKKIMYYLNATSNIVTNILIKIGKTNAHFGGVLQVNTLFLACGFGKASEAVWQNQAVILSFLCC